MKRKLALAGALLHQPPVLILDEPLNGLDPRSARRLKDLFVEQARNGTTILLSTHDLATAEAVCHRVGIIHRGQLLAEGSASSLEQMASASDLEAVFLSLTSEEAPSPILRPYKERWLYEHLAYSLAHTNSICSQWCTL
jgi:ABC-2 type transport system ATP-binding protein